MMFDFYYNLWRNRMGFFRENSEKDDKQVAEVADYLLGTVSNADAVGNIEVATGRNVRDQLTVEEAQEMYEEGRLRGFGNRRN